MKVAGALLVVAAASLASQAWATSPPVALSPRNANYSIEVEFHPETRTLRATQEIAWTNLAPRAADELRFHLYWNAFRNDQSTWMREDRYRERAGNKGQLPRALTANDWGFVVIDRLSIDDQALTGALRFDAPDDGNPEDRTVAVVPLPAPVPPQGKVVVRLQWHAKIPRAFARTGFRGDNHFFAHWFPQLGVFTAEGWSCHQFHAATEFFADFGVYDVTMTVPARYVLGATGREVERKALPDGRVRHRYLQEDVHGFAWAASPDFEVRQDVFRSPGLPQVALRLLVRPEHRGQSERLLAATRATLEHYGRWYGAYPYRQLTVIDPAYRDGSGGMEYPTLFVAGTRLFAPERGGVPEEVTVHEAGHQFWYGVVANDETEHAWIDEGLNTFSTARVLDAVYPPMRHVKRYFRPPGTAGDGFLPWRFDDVVYDRMIHGNRLHRLRRAPASDAQGKPSFLYFPATAGRVTYDQTALWLGTLERYLGWPTLQKILQTFFQRFAFRHPRPEDFFAVANEVSGRDLGWFFDEVHREARRFDYAVSAVRSDPVALEGYAEPGPGREPEYRKDARGKATLYQSDVVVRRLGDGRFPVDVLLVFEDGKQVRRRWDGRDRWTLVSERHGARLRHAIVDPEHVLLLDLDRGNNSRLREERSTFPAAKWASKWMIWLQDYLLAMTAFL